MPGQSRLFIQYQESPRSLSEYYPKATADLSELAETIPAMLENYRTPRGKLCDALLEMNVRFGAGEPTLKNIELLREEGTVAVLTGQQAGLFTGPVYTIYKALSAIKAAAELSAAGIPAVPVFWAATEDHDIDEVSNAFVIDSAGSPKEFRVASSHYVEGQSVGDVRLDRSIEGVIDELESSLPRTEFTAGIADELRSAWRPETGFGEAFLRQMLTMLGRFGLVAADPLDAELKRLAAPIYTLAVERADEIAAALLERSRELESEGFHAQVHVAADSFPLFWHTDEGKRTALKIAGDGLFSAAGREFTRAELVELIAADPRRFSPAVMLRPVVQDHLFPTACYFGGGAEIAYFAQNSEVYRILERPVTPIFHRQSFTVIESANRRTMAKYTIEPADLFEGAEKTERRVSEEILDPGTAAMFADVEEKINGQLNRLDRELSHLDPNLAKNLATRRRKIVYHIGALRNKTRVEQLKKHGDAARRLSALASSTMPGGTLQERVVGVVSFLGRYGPSFIDELYAVIDMDDRGHRVVFL